MEIVRASPAEQPDAEPLLAEYYETIGVVERDTPESLIAYLSGADTALWLAYVDGAAAGCVAFRPLALPALAAGQRAGECKRMYVRPGFRRRGVAEALLSELEAYARREGYRWIYLDSKGDMQAAHRFYAKRGYTACDRYNRNPQAEVFLRKTL